MDSGIDTTRALEHTLLVRLSLTSSLLRRSPTGIDPTSPGGSITRWKPKATTLSPVSTLELSTSPTQSPPKKPKIGLIEAPLEALNALE